VIIVSPGHNSNLKLHQLQNQTVLVRRVNQPLLVDGLLQRFRPARLPSGHG